MFYSLIQHYSYYSQIGYFTFDNNNDTTTIILEPLLEDKHKLAFDPKKC